MHRISWRARATSRRRLGPDTPRPAGRRRWTGRLRRGGGVLARRVLRAEHRSDGELIEPPYRPVYPPGRVRGPYGGAAGPPVTAPAESGPAESGPAEPGPAEAWAAAPAAGLDRLLPGVRTAQRQLRFTVVSACTLTSLALGMLAILLAMHGDARTAAACLVACVVCDGLDGLLARRLGVTSPFGAQLDSLADMCAFGVAAPVVLYASLSGSVPEAGAAVACALVAASAAVRLARFNVSGKDSRFFTGVPTTLAAGVLAVAVLVDLPLPPSILLSGAAALAFAMVSNFPYATLGRVLRLPLWLWLMPLAGLLIEPRLTFVVLVGAYLTSGPVLWMRHRRPAAERAA